jgi:hypothetical protein
MKPECVRRTQWRAADPGRWPGRPNTRLNASLVLVHAAMRATAASRFGWPISTELTIGSAACSSSVLARPSQNCVLL